MNDKPDQFGAYLLHVMETLVREQFATSWEKGAIDPEAFAKHEAVKVAEREWETRLIVGRKSDA